MDTALLPLVALAIVWVVAYAARSRLRAGRSHLSDSPFAPQA